ncbi:hypothetical protein [Candidatus Rariloculus sp.]|uniref:hypothetical protein n=1 Tax=Candidatus Rariloculus sp. TaxID=3101265 RepID=UPI003D0EC97B
MGKTACTRTALIRVLLSTAMISAPAFAEIDLSGEWGPRYHEDQPERIPGPSLVEYEGIPINEAGRLRGLSWSSSLLSVPEHQCKPHPSDYAHRGPGRMRIWKEIDSASQELIAIHTRLRWQAPERTIWMDGRPHPPEYAAHTWQGFSTGEWDGDVLVVTTTHLKQGWLRRNGLPRSDIAQMNERFIRHGDYLTQIVVINDPVYLSEPFIRTNNWVLDVRQQITPYLCDIVDEVAFPRGTIPHYLPGLNPFVNEHAETYGIPLEAALGGAATTYPDFIE